MMRDCSLVDEYLLFLTPISVGGDKPSPRARVRLTLELVDERRFGSGRVYRHSRAGT